MSVKREIKWFSNKVTPENGSLIIIKTNIVNIFEDYDEDSYMYLFEEAKNEIDDKNKIKQLLKVFNTLNMDKK